MGRTAGKAETGNGDGNGDGDGAAAPGVKANTTGRKDCFHCGKMDHWSMECPHLVPELRQELKELGQGGWAELCRQGKVGQQQGQSHINVGEDSNETSKTSADREEARGPSPTTYTKTRPS